jgi:hypothetical protein
LTKVEPALLVRLGKNIAQRRAQRPNENEGNNLPPLVKTARVKIEFSFLNRNLMVRAGHPSIFDSKATIERAALDGQSRRLHWRQGASVMTGVGDVLRVRGKRSMGSRHAGHVICRARPYHLNSAKISKLQQRQNSYLRKDRHVSSDLAINILPPTAKWFRLSLPFHHRVSAGAAWPADGRQI